MSETREFFAAVWPGGLEDGDSLLLWTRQGRVSRWADSTEEAAQLAGDLGAEKDVYVGVGAGPAPADRSESRRLKASEVRTLPGHVADLDVAGAGHKKENLFASREEVLQAVERLELQPSLMVASGGGLQLWWLYREPWILETDDERERRPQVQPRRLRALDRRAGGRQEPDGGRRRPGGARQGRRLEAGDVDRPRRPLPRGLELPGRRLQQPLRVRPRDGHEDVGRRVERGRDPGGAYSLAPEAQPRHQAGELLPREDDSAGDGLGEREPEPPGDPRPYRDHGSGLSRRARRDRKKKIQEQVHLALGIPIDRIERIGDLYVCVLKSGVSFKLGTAEQAIRQVRWHSICWANQISITKLNDRAWTRVCDFLSLLVVDVKAADATPEGSIVSWIVDSKGELVDLTGEDENTRAEFYCAAHRWGLILGGEIYVHGPRLKTRLSNSGWRIHDDDLVFRLKAIGATRTRLQARRKVEPEDGSAQHVKRWYWRLPKAFLNA